MVPWPAARRCPLSARDLVHSLSLAPPGSAGMPPSIPRLAPATVPSASARNQATHLPPLGRATYNLLVGTWATNRKESGCWGGYARAFVAAGAGIRKQEVRVEPCCKLGNQAIPCAPVSDDLAVASLSQLARRHNGSSHFEAVPCRSLLS